MKKRTKTTLGVVHVTATPADMNLTSASLRSMHAIRGFSDIGYNEWINRKGKLILGRGVEFIGAHVRGYNSISYGIALEGGRNGFDITDAQMRTLEKRMGELSKRYPKIKWCGHRDLSPDGDGDGVIEPHEHTKACPQFDVIPWAKARGLPVADIKGVWDHKKKHGAPDGRDAWLQRLLAGLGYPVGPIDGIVGGATRKAIKLFQDAHGLRKTGNFDKITVAKLRALAEQGGAVKIAAVPEALNKPLVKSGGFIERVATISASGGAIYSAAFGDYRTTLVLVGAIIILSVLGLLFHQRIIKAVKEIKLAVEENGL